MREVTDRYHNGRIKTDKVATGEDPQTFILVDYFEDGTVKQETSFKGGMVEGYVKTFDRIGHVELASYRAGMLHGPWTLHHDGILVMSCEYKDGKLTTGNAGS